MEHSKDLLDALHTLKLQGVDLSRIITCVPGESSVKDNPVTSKNRHEFVDNITDILVQCLNTEELVTLDAVHKAFMSLFREDIKASLTALFKHCETTLNTDDSIRKMVLRYIRDKVLPLLAGELLKPQDEMERHITDLIKKIIVDVSGEESNIFMAFLTRLSIFNGKKYTKEKSQEVADLFAGQAGLDAKFNITDTHHVDRLISCMEKAIPYIMNGGTGSKFLILLNKHIMLDFDKLPKHRKLDLLRPLAEISQYSTVEVAREMLPSVVQLLKKYMHAKKTEKEIYLTHIECILYMFHQLAHKAPNETNSLCGYKIVTGHSSDRLMEDLSECHKDFTDRLINIEDLTKATIRKLAQRMHEHDISILAATDEENKSCLDIERENTKTEIRSCINVLAMTKVLHAEAPSFIGDTTSVNISWSDPKCNFQLQSASTRVLSLDNPKPPNMDALDKLIEWIPLELVDKLFNDGICELEENLVQALVDLSRFEQAQSPLRESEFLLHDNGLVAGLFWKIRKLELLEFLMTKSWKEILGPIRDQLEHLLCWAYVSSDLVSGLRIIRKWEREYVPLCRWYLCAFTSPTSLGQDERAPKHHKCYGCEIETCLLHIQNCGIPEEICHTFNCSDFEPPSADEPGMDRRKISVVQKIDTLEEALLLLPQYPIAATLIVYSELWRRGERIYCGPEPNSDSSFMGYHAVIIMSVELYEEDVVAICKMSNGTSVAHDGYVMVSLRTMFMIVGVSDKKQDFVRATSKPMHLLSDFYIIDMVEKGK